ncbi:MAG: hypothetical protein PF481_08380 [Bacteroidales bacterium]|jgi:transposase-like protein|nr:hypothetical protein [Bacteroidales bacterium]
MRTEQEMFPLIEQWQESGLTKKQFAKEHNIHEKTFYYWQYKYARKTTSSISKEQKASFIEIQNNQSTERNLHMEIALEKGVTIRIYK